MVVMSADGSSSSQPEGHTIRLILDFPETIPNLAPVRQTARFMMDSFGLCEEDAAELELLIGELTGNAVRHAHGGYRLEMELQDDQTVVNVIDHGTGFSPDTLPAPGTQRSDELSNTTSSRIGGFGLPLVYSLADQVEFQHDPSHGMTVRAVKKLRPRL